MICCSVMCERNRECGKFMYNLSTKYQNQPLTVESLATFGWGSLDANGCKIECVCGENGGYALYEPIEIEKKEFDRGYEQGGKDMAKKLLQEMYSFSKKYTWMCLSPEDIEMFADKYGVEVE